MEMASEWAKDSESALNSSRSFSKAVKCKKISMLIFGAKILNLKMRHTQCFEITQNVAFEFLNFAIFQQFLSF